MPYQYDKQKAHDYYEKHKKLKGRTKGFSESQREQAQYAKYVINQDKSRALKEITNRHSAQRKSENDRITTNAKAKREQITAKCKELVATLREKLKGLTPDEKARIKEQISSIRAKYAGEKKSITSNASDSKKANSLNHKINSQNEKAQVRANAEKAYNDALNEIRNKG